MRTKDDINLVGDSARIRSAFVSVFLTASTGRKIVTCHDTRLIGAQPY